MKKGSMINMLRSHVALIEPAVVYYSFYCTNDCIEDKRNAVLEGSKGILYLEEEDKVAREIYCDISDPNLPEEAKKGRHGISEMSLSNIHEKHITI
jgi:hypothetical protein